MVLQGAFLSYHMRHGRWTCGGGDLGEIRNSVSGLTLRIKVLTLGKNGDNISEPTLIIRGLSLVNLVTAFLN